MISRQTNEFDAFLDFWRFEESGDVRDASVGESDGLSWEADHALVYVRGGGSPQLCRFDDGGYLYAALTPFQAIPDGLEVRARISATDGSAHSFILEDPQRKIVYLPFSPDQAIEGFRREMYRAPAGGGRKRALSAYYALKRFVPRSLLMKARSFVARRQMHSQSFPAWPIETSLDDLQRRLLSLLLGVVDRPRLPFVWFWPNGATAALTLTHDVEGVSGKEMVDRFIEIESAHGFVSSFNFVPHKYTIEPELLERVRAGGHEIGVHGWDHEGSLVASRELFNDRAGRINDVSRTWNCTGFRSPSTYRHPDWFAEKLRFEYDSSFPDSDPYEPQAGGCLSWFPYPLGPEMLELPITMPQDHTLFILLGQQDTSVWNAKADALNQRHGMICMLTHPDTEEGYTGSDRVMAHYESMLERFAADSTLWHALPRDVARWWQARARATLVAEQKPEDPVSVCGADGARVAWASIRDGKLTFEVENHG